MVELQHDHINKQLDRLGKSIGETNIVSGIQGKAFSIIRLYSNAKAMLSQTIV